jgi:pilus assembly protein CpaB
MRMSRILLLVVALVAGGLAAFLATRPTETAPPATAKTEIVEEARVKVLVAATPIGMGERLSPANIAWRDWPAGAVLADYITDEAMPEATTQMRGTVARFEIFEGDPIRQQKLVKSEQGYLSAVLSQGKRGVSIGVNAEAASGGFIVPNDHVDVVLTRSSGSGSRAETILSNVRVLAIDKRLGEVGSSGGKKTEAEAQDSSAQTFSNQAIATLELDPGQAETVINAQQLGRLSLALRSIVDFGALDQAGPDQTRRNAAIRIIRYGVEQNVVTGTQPNAAQINEAGYTPPPPPIFEPLDAELRPSVDEVEDTSMER